MSLGAPDSIFCDITHVKVTKTLILSYIWYHANWIVVGQIRNVNTREEPGHQRYIESSMSKHGISFSTAF